MSFNNQNKVTEAELADDLKQIIINAESDHERSIYEEIELSNVKIKKNSSSSYATSITLEKNEALSGAGVTYTLNKDAVEGYYYISTSSDTKYSLAAMLESGTHTFSIDLAKRTSTTNIVLEFTDAAVYDRDGNIIVGNNTATAKLPIYYYTYLYAHSAESPLSDLNTVTGLTSKLIADYASTTFSNVTSNGDDCRTYVYIPTSWLSSKTPKFTVGGFEGGFMTDGDTITRTVNSVSTSYTIYYSTNKGMSMTIALSFS